MFMSATIPPSPALPSIPEAAPKHCTESGAAIKYWAVVLAHRAIDAGRRAAATRAQQLGLGQALDPATPQGLVLEALDQLQIVVGHFQSATGHDGLQLAHDVIADGFGKPTADYALASLFNSRNNPALEGQIDQLLCDDPQPSAAEVAQTIHAMLARSFGTAEMAALRGHLDALHALPVASDQANIQHAREAVGAACQAAADAGVPPAQVQDALDLWTDATGGARVVVNVV